MRLSPLLPPRGVCLALALPAVLMAQQVPTPAFHSPLDRRLKLQERARPQVVAGRTWFVWRAEEEPWKRLTRGEVEVFLDKAGGGYLHGEAYQVRNEYLFAMVGVFACVVNEFQKAGLAWSLGNVFRMEAPGAPPAPDQKPAPPRTQVVLTAVPDGREGMAAWMECIVLDGGKPIAYLFTAPFDALAASQDVVTILRASADASGPSGAR